MKSKIKCGIAAAVVVAAGFAAYQSYGAYGAQDNSLLMQNIEALASNADAEGDAGDDLNRKSKGTCGQKTEYRGTEGLIMCPKCKMGTGFTGTVYSYQKKGTQTQYKEGLVGKEVVCNPYCGFTIEHKEENLETKDC